MREIKCKAWDIKTKKMREVHSISFHNKRDIYHYNESNTPKVINLWGYDIIEQKDIVLHRESNEVILLEYTGLKDKNGKAIYEGDILKLVLVDWSDVQEDIFTVSSDNFVEDVCYLKAIVSHAKDVESETDSIEVIGNIYEHKHLLEEKKHV